MRFVTRVFAMVVVVGVLPWSPVAAQGTSTQKIERGRFVSFKGGTLTIQFNSGAMIENKLPANIKTLVWSHDEKTFKSADAVQALKQILPGTWVVVRTGMGNVTLQIGARKGETIGTFVSFKNDRLLIFGTNLGESFVKKYGNAVHFNKFREDVPIYESIDGGAYQNVSGTARTILASIKEGTVVNVHGEGDDNITRIEIGVAKK